MVTDLVLEVTPMRPEGPFPIFMYVLYFRGQKLSRDEKNAKCLTKTFANDSFWDKFRGKNFREEEKKFIFGVKKLSRMARSKNVF